MNTLLTVIPVLADTDWGMHGDIGSGWGIVMMIGMMLFWVALFCLAVWLVRTVTGPRTSEQKTPLEVLQHRLAQGEISVEDYDRLREKLIASN